MLLSIIYNLEIWNNIQQLEKCSLDIIHPYGRILHNYKKNKLKARDQKKILSVFLFWEQTFVARDDVSCFSQWSFLPPFGYPWPLLTCIFLPFLFIYLSNKNSLFLLINFHLFKATAHRLWKERQHCVYVCAKTVKNTYNDSTVIKVMAPRKAT